MPPSRARQLSRIVLLVFLAGSLLSIRPIDRSRPLGRRHAHDVSLLRHKGRSRLGLAARPAVIAAIAPRRNPGRSAGRMPRLAPVDRPRRPATPLPGPVAGRLPARPARSLLLRC